MSSLRAAIASLAMLVTFAAMAGQGCDDLCGPDALHGYAHLLARSFGSPAEQAAFVIKGRDGKVRLIQWTSGEDLRASYAGRIPLGAVAVAHTHPLRDRQPSPHDIAEAKRIGMPIIVITLQALTIAQTDGRVEALATGSAWHSFGRDKRIDSDPRVRVSLPRAPIDLILRAADASAVSAPLR